MTLSQVQVDFFAQNGYLPYGALLNSSEIELLREQYDLEFEKARESGNYRNLAVGDQVDAETKNSAPQQMLQILQMGEKNIHFRKLAYDRRLLDLVQDLIGPNIMLFHDQALSKPARTGGPVFWHQDNAYWRCVPANLLSCWLTLDDVRRENGAMHLIPGSHLQPMRHEKSDSTDALLDLGKQVDDSKAVVVDLPAGGCMFHHCQTLHYTPPNRTDGPRRAFAIHYMTPGTRNGQGDVIHVSFSNPMLRMAI